MTEEEVRDPTDNNFWKKIQERAHTNTEIYREIFGCDPDDTVRSTAELTKMRQKIAMMKPEEQYEKYNAQKNKILGHVVDWPEHFLEDEDLSLNWTNIEGLLPEINFI